jgi:pectate lyase
MQYRLLAAVLALGVSAAPGPQITPAPKALKARDSLPASSGSSKFSSPKTISAGGSYDGGMYMIDRGVSCTGQEEGGDSDAVFILEEGASLSNVIIGPNQIEGVHVSRPPDGTRSFAGAC